MINKHYLEKIFDLLRLHNQKLSFKCRSVEMKRWYIVVQKLSIPRKSKRGNC